MSRRVAGLTTSRASGESESARDKVALERVIELMNARADDLARRTVEIVKTNVSGYRQIPDEEIFFNVWRTSIARR